MRFLFTYGPGRNHTDHLISGYIPIFMEAYNPVLKKMKAGLRKRALRICEQSFQCVFDIAVTGRVDKSYDGVSELALGNETKSSG